MNETTLNVAEENSEEIVLFAAEEASEASEETATEAATVVADEKDSFITPDAFVASLPYVGKGMFGIFLVTALIIGSVALLNKLTNPKKKKDDNK